MMKNLIYVSLVAFMFVLLTTFATAIDKQNGKENVSSEDIPNIPIPMPINMVNLDGIWNYKTSSGLAGTMRITQKGKDVTLEIISGSECRPTAVCYYTGSLEENNKITLSNSVTVDKEGGEVTSAMALTYFSDPSVLTGSSTHHYVHPEGYEKRWDMEFEITREEKK